MPLDSTIWSVISPSQFAWEQDALTFLKQNLNPQQVLKAWSNFELLTPHGALYEVDLLLFTTTGLFLVEVKSWEGAVVAGHPLWHLKRTATASTTVVDNPLILANQKARILAGMLRSHKAFLHRRPPYVDAVVFLGAPDVKLKLQENLRGHVYTRRSVLGAFQPEPGARLVDLPTRKATLEALKDAGIRRRSAAHQVGDYRLGDLLGEGPGYQDRLGNHVSFDKTVRRVRIYNVADAGSQEEHDRVRRAARREFSLTESIQHPGVLRALDFKESEYGPALVFEFVPDAQRLDQYVGARGEQLDLPARLALLRQLAEILRYAHNRKLVHRALAPQNVLVLHPDETRPELRVFNWQTGFREDEVTGTVHVLDLLESPATAYVAPEAIHNPATAGEYSDVFSLGAVAFFLLSGQAPAASQVELFHVLQRRGGLSLSAALDGVSRELDELVAWSTRPDVADRLASVDDFLKLLDGAEGARDMAGEVVADPCDAVPGDLLPGGLEVVRRLGRGSVALALLVRRDDQEMVLKVAHDIGHNERLTEEGEVLKRLDHRQIVSLVEVVEVGPRRGLLLAKVGDTTLAQRLRQEGRLQLELLQRFGDDLLGLVAYLEKVGISHRDLKPNNLSVAPLGKEEELHLFLFDFSLSRTPAENVRAGTPGYLDPFLVLRKRWDLAAERFSAAVTLYEMATGTLPRWGDGRSDPALVPNAPLMLEADRFDPSLRETLTAFFEKALHRDASQRFDNAEDMRADWNRALRAAGESSLAGGPVPEAERRRLLEEATLDTPVPALGLSESANQALDQLDVLTVKQLLELPQSTVLYRKGLGNQTRSEIRDALKVLRERFPTVDVEPESLVGAEVSSLDLVLAELVGAASARKGVGGPDL
ncbi:MAG: protein kinase, partial [Candidatus Eremiobacterota bacterium]